MVLNQLGIFGGGDNRCCAMRGRESYVLLLFDIFGEFAQGLVKVSKRIPGSGQRASYRLAFALLVRKCLYCFRGHSAEGGAMRQSLDGYSSNHLPSALDTSSKEESPDFKYPVCCAALCCRGRKSHRVGTVIGRQERSLPAEVGNARQGQGQRRHATIRYLPRCRQTCTGHGESLQNDAHEQ